MESTTLYQAAASFTSRCGLSLEFALIALRYAIAIIERGRGALTELSRRNSGGNFPREAERNVQKGISENKNQSWPLDFPFFLSFFFWFVLFVKLKIINKKKKQIDREKEIRTQILQ